MSISALQRMKMPVIVAASLLAASLMTPCAVAQANRPATPPVPVAPAGGVDPSKLPDIQGIHLGTSPEDALARLKVLYPPKGKDYGVTPMYEKLKESPGTSPWVSALAATINPCAPTSTCGDQTEITFNTPPNKVGAMSIRRGIQFQTGKEPTPDTIKAALVQKYGPNPFVINPNLYGWAYDEEGKPIAPANGKTRIQCAGNVMAAEAGGPSPAAATAAGAIKSNAPLTQADVNDLMRDQCRVGVFVLANVTVIGPAVTTMDIKISENSADTRTVIALQQYLDKLAAGQQQQQLDKAKQQAVPKF